MEPADAFVRTFRSESPEGTEALAEAVGAAAFAGLLLTLNGDLGAGKTTFARGLGRGLGVTEPVTSPTYTLMDSYTSGRLPFHHFDAWMEGREKAFLADGADEFLGGDGVALVEWAERIDGWLPGDRLEVQIRHMSPEERVLELTWRSSVRLDGHGEGQGAGRRLLESLEVPPDVVEIPGAGQKA